MEEDVRESRGGDPVGARAVPVKKSYTMCQIRISFRKGVGFGRTSSGSKREEKGRARINRRTREERGESRE